MNKKGFTLIELLAVIVILAIIALIATPIILNVIEDAKKSAAVDSAYGYIEAIEFNNAMVGVNNKYTIITESDVITINGKVNVKGTKPTSGTVTIENGKVTNANICISGYNVNYNGTEATANGSKCNGGSSNESAKKYTVYQNGTAVYFDPVSNTKCTEYVETNSNTGINSGCLKFYTFNDEGENTSTVNMILDHNTTGDIALSAGMETAQNALNSTTSSWDKNLNIRLITADEIAQITGNTNFDSKTALYGSSYYFQTNSNANPGYNYEGTYSWLYDNTIGCTTYGCKKTGSGTNGYWTSTIAYDPDYKGAAWHVYKEGNLRSTDMKTSGESGIRPVITVEKNLIK